MDILGRQKKLLNIGLAAHFYEAEFWIFGHWI